MHLSQKKVHLTTFDLRMYFLLLRIHKKEDDLTSFGYLNLMQLHSHKFWAKLKIQDYVIQPNMLKLAACQLSFS